MMNKRLSIAQLARYRASATAAVRSHLEERGATEVRTPILSTIPDLAPVRQFLCQHPQTGKTYCLRIAPEEHLTRLIGLGVSSVYEFSTNFRCETADNTHLIEFESIEALFADATVSDMLELMEMACRVVALAGKAVKGETAWELPPSAFPRIRIPDWIETELGMPSHFLTTQSTLMQVAKALGCDPANSPMPKLMDDVIGAIATQVGGALFVGIFPAFLGGPAERDPTSPHFISRYELYYNGLELGSAAQQLRDVQDWRNRYKHNMELKRVLDIEPNFINEELLNDISSLPRFAGMGLGFERMLTLGLGFDDIRNVRLFDN